jgi:mannan endo-1,4-beta-mannosidase
MTTLRWRSATSAIGLAALILGGCSGDPAGSSGMGAGASCPEAAGCPGAATSTGGAAAIAGAGAGAGQVGAPSAGAAGTAGGASAPAGNPGVVVSSDGSGTLSCVPLCANSAHADDTNLTDDWAWEGFACVLSDSPTGTRNQACTTGQALPPLERSGFAGVVVDAGGDGMLDCVPLCGEGAMPPNLATPDWGWEYQASCVVRGTGTARCNQTCLTGQPLPSATLIQRAGVVIDDLCTASCQCMSAGTDPSWGWEYQQKCVMPGTTPTVGRPVCATNDAGGLMPPALVGAAQPGFYVQAGRLYDALGAEFVMRGVNSPHIWFDVDNQYLAYQALTSIASYNTNTVRVVWETTGGSAALLRRVLYRIVELKMVPMLELHDATGSTSNAELSTVARYYLNADVKQVLLDFRAYLLINIANEWSGTDFANAYGSVIAELRSGGLDHTLVIDANGFGQNASSIFDNAQTLTTADPKKNLLFSVHMYDKFTSSAEVDAVLDRAQTGMVPLIVGEFGAQFQGKNVAWSEITAKCQAHRLGYLAWSWSGNDAATGSLNIVNGFGGALTPSWGKLIMTDDANSIQKTATKATIFK